MMTREQVISFLKDVLDYSMIQNDFTKWASTFDTEYGIKLIADQWMLDQAEIVQQYDPLASSNQPFEV